MNERDKEKGGRLVIYHSPCMDGMGARLAAEMRFGESAEYLGADYGANEEELARRCAGRDVLMVDVSFSREGMERMEEAAKSLRVVDHHESAEKELAGMRNARFDKNRAGCALTFDELFPGETLPKFFEYLEDHDLYRFALPDSEALYMHISGLPQTTEAYAEALRSFETEEGLRKAVEAGKAILARHNAWCTETAERAEEVEIEGVKGLALNFDGPTTMKNRIGRILAEKSGTFGCLWRMSSRDGSVSASLRGTGSVKVNDLARSLADRLGGRGGGHPNAAGLGVPGEGWLSELRSRAEPEASRKTPRHGL